MKYLGESLKINGKVYQYVENVTTQRNADEDAKAYRKTGNLARVIVRRDGLGRPRSYDVYVYWKSRGKK